MTAESLASIISADVHCPSPRNAKHLKDMEIVVNKMDEAMVLPGTDNDVNARYASPQCQNASEDFQYSRHLHGSINSPKSNFNLSKALLPVFSQTKVNCSQQ